ncbi:hypothetical protein BHE74_00041742 [Ensete ventricosum]|nr:hypothetical protein GW17_00043912 [Ensete ventricosum]RWW51878.1 hypothetical protein BHE74_00041742 [Ensete ventricosum]RZS15630.1 hypothetical protein BHM03_00047488 [Ensete ventricosum]
MSGSKRKLLKELCSLESSTACDDRERWAYSAATRSTTTTQGRGTAMEASPVVMMLNQRYMEVPPSDHRSQLHRNCLACYGPPPPDTFFSVKSVELSLSNLLRREKKAILSSLHHPNIISYLGFDGVVVEAPHGPSPSPL